VVTGKVHGGEIHPELVSVKTTCLDKELPAVERQTVSLLWAEATLQVCSILMKG